MRRLSLNYPSYLLIILAWIHQLTKSSDSQNGIARSAFDVDESIDESEFLLGFCHSTGFLVMLRLHLFFLSPFTQCRQGRHWCSIWSESTLCRASFAITDYSGAAYSCLHANLFIMHDTTFTACYIIMYLFICMTLFALLAMFGVSLLLIPNFWVTVYCWFAGDGRATEEGERTPRSPRPVRISVLHPWATTRDTRSYQQ